MEDTVRTELDEVKKELEKFRAECRVKTQYIENLKNDRDERFQEIMNLAEKRAGELDLKSEEIYELKRINEDLKSSLNEKEKYIVHFGLENRKIQERLTERVLKLEGSNSELVSSLDEVNARNSYLEQNVSASSEEILCLKSLLSATEKKYIEAEERAMRAKTLGLREDVIMQLQEQNVSVNDKMKWRNEQFKHLEEAHKQLQDKYRLSEEEWEKERSLLLDELSSLQISLDSQTRALEGVQSRLEMCNHALAREESKRKLLEAEISDFKTSLEDVYGQCEEKKSEIQQLTIMRDHEVAELRNSLGEKEALVKELKRKIVYLEQDNQELGDSLKELREAQIRYAGGNSMASKLRNKLRKLEDVHKNCSSTLKSRESQWNDKITKMEVDIVGYKSTLNNKEQEIRELMMELEKCCYANEENHIELLIFKSVLAEGYSNSFGTETDKVVCVEVNEDMILNFTEQLRVKDNSLKSLAQHQFLLEEELQQQKKLLEESSAGQFILKEQLLQMENTLKHERKVAFEALERVKHELASKNDKLSRLNCEAQNWKSTAETLKVLYEEIQGSCKEMETSIQSQIENEQALKQENKNLLCIVKDQERETEDLHLQIGLLESCNAEKTKEVERCKKEKDELVKTVTEKDCCIKDLQKDITVACQKQESMKKQLEDAVLAHLDAQKALAQKEDHLSKFQTSLKDMELETKKLTKEKEEIEQIIADIKFEKGNLLQDITKLSTEREDILAQTEYIYDKLGDLLSIEGMQLTEELRNMLHTSIADGNETAMDSVVCDKLHGCAQDSTNKQIEENFDARLPLREVNSLHI
ncbi:unnamed protein product [Lathyrus sativus]|nr:unnamed protein product [Lathyrus sativus]